MSETPANSDTPLDETHYTICTICLDPTVPWLASRGSCCGELTCIPCRDIMKEKGHGDRCAVCRQPTPTSAKSYEHLRERAVRGHGWALALLGERTQSGRPGLPKDPVEAARLFHLAVEKGEVNALGKLAFAYAMGIGVPKNHERAIPLFRRAIALGEPRAIIMFAELLILSGEPAAHDDAVKLVELVVAAYDGCADGCTANRLVPVAQSLLADAFMRNAHYTDNAVIGAWWCQAATASGSADAQHNMNIIAATCSNCAAKAPAGAPFAQCSGCKCAFYCGRECQRSAYKAHKPACKRVKAMDAARAAALAAPRSDAQRVRIARGLSPDEPDADAA
jgi:TPR repeat protein